MSAQNETIFFNKKYQIFAQVFYFEINKKMVTSTYTSTNFNFINARK
jgi:hypothetical protein